MKRTIIAGAVVVFLICAIGAVQAVAAGLAPAAGDATPGRQPFAVAGDLPGGRFEAGIGWGEEPSAEEIAEREAAWAQRGEKLKAFIESLTEEQKAAFDELFGGISSTPDAAEPGFGGRPQFRHKGGGGRENPGAPGGLRRELSEEERTQMEAARLQCEEKLATFLQTLSSEQKALYEAMTPQIDKPAAGQPPARLDENAFAAMKEAREAFIASLSEMQKALYDEIMSGPFYRFRQPGQPIEDAGPADARLQKHGRNTDFGADAQSIYI